MQVLTLTSVVAAEKDTLEYILLLRSLKCGAKIMVTRPQCVFKDYSKEN